MIRWSKEITVPILLKNLVQRWSFSNGFCYKSQNRISKFLHLSSLCSFVLQWMVPSRFLVYVFGWLSVFLILFVIIFVSLAWPLITDVSQRQDYLLKLNFLFTISWAENYAVLNDIWHQFLMLLIHNHTPKTWNQSINYA